MILIYDEDCDIKVGETLTIEWVGGESNEYVVARVKFVDNRYEVEVVEL